MIIDYYYYHSLSDKEKKIYMAIYEAIKAHEETVKFSNKEVSKVDFNKIIACVIKDNPQLFYVDASMIKISGELTSTKLEFIYKYDANEVAQLWNKLQACMGTYLSAVKDMTAADKALRIYEEMVNNNEYDFSDSIDSDCFQYNHTILGPLLEGKGVCEAFAKTYKLLLNAADVKCLIVDGDSENIAQPGEDVGHSWNIVKVDDDCFHVDITWAIGQGNTEYINYDYYGLSDQLIIEDHKNFVGTPKCSTDKYNYFVMNQSVAKSRDDMFEMIKAKINIPGRAYVRLDYECDYMEESKACMEMIKEAVANDSYKVAIKSLGRPSQKILMICLDKVMN